MSAKNRSVVAHVYAQRPQKSARLKQTYARSAHFGQVGRKGDAGNVAFGEVDAAQRRAEKARPDESDFGKLYPLQAAGGRDRRLPSSPQ